jgi:hypothetical protein
MKTILGNEIPKNTRGIVYLCLLDFFGKTPKLNVVREIFCEDAFLALTLYAEIPNPASQLVTGKTFEELIINLEKLHKDMKNPKWLEELTNSI